MRRAGQGVKAVDLEVHAAPEGATQPTMAPQDEPVSILVVDDDEAQVNLISAFLRRNGYRVLTAPNPVKALELLQTDTVKLIITDLMMPHVDGIAFTEQVHAMDKFKDLPVIMITAYGSDEITDKGMRKGVALTLAKPLQLSKLLDLVGFATH
jgi:two-component system chemotaxis response regulator CheY